MINTFQFLWFVRGWETWTKFLFLENSLTNFRRIIFSVWNFANWMYSSILHDISSKNITGEKNIPIPTNIRIKKFAISITFDIIVKQSNSNYISCIILLQIDRFLSILSALKRTPLYLLLHCFIGRFIYFYIRFPFITIFPARKVSKPNLDCKWNENPGLRASFSNSRKNIFPGKRRRGGEFFKRIVSRSFSLMYTKGGGG